MSFTLGRLQRRKRMLVNTKDTPGRCGNGRVGLGGFDEFRLGLINFIIRRIMRIIRGDLISPRLWGSVGWIIRGRLQCLSHTLLLAHLSWEICSTFIEADEEEEAGDCCSEVAQSYSPPPAGQWPRTLHPQSLFARWRYIRLKRENLIHQAGVRKLSFFSIWFQNSRTFLCCEKSGQSDDEDQEQMKKWE